MTTYAGRFGPEGIEYPDGTHVANRDVMVYLYDGVTPAVLYSDRDRTAQVANPIRTDEIGNLMFWANPGNYACEIENNQFTIQIPKDPEEPEGSSGGGFTHVQSTPSATWMIPNTLGHYPGSVAIVVDDEEVSPDITFPSVGQIVATFATAQAGRAEVRS